MSNWIIAVITLLASTACRATPPDWYLEPPQDSAEYLYGVGAGVTQANARHQALMDLTGRLQVKVEGSLQTQTRVSNGRVSASANQRVRSENSPLTLTNYELHDARHSDGTFYQLVRVQREALLTGLRQQLRQHLDQYQRLRQQQPSPLRELRELMAHQPSADAARTLVAVLQQQQQPLPNLSDLRWYERRLAEASNHRVITLKLDNTSEQTREYLNRWLNDAGFREGGASPLATLSFSIKAQPARELFGQYHSSVEGKFVVEDQGEVLSVRRLSATGVSSLSGEQAKAVAERQILRQIAGNDIWQLLLPM